MASMQRRQLARTQGPDGKANLIKQFTKLSPKDAVMFAQEGMFDWFRDTAVEGRRQGNFGAEEFVLIRKPWNFSVRDLSVPGHVIYGDGDPLAPGIRAWLAETPNLTSEELDGGHVLIGTAIGRRALFAAYATVSGSVEA